jgi:hypothetical protein
MKGFLAAAAVASATAVAEVLGFAWLSKLSSLTPSTV